MTYLLTIVSFDASQLATITLFSVLLNYFFVLASVHVYLDTLSPVFLELGRLMLSVCLTKIRLLCCQFPSGDEANSVNCLHGVQDKVFLNRSLGNVTQTTSSRSGLQTDYSHIWARQSRFLHRVSFLPILALCFLSCSEIILVSFSLFLYFSFLFLLFYVIIIFYKNYFIIIILL